jgi:hypothetical protein
MRQLAHALNARESLHPQHHESAVKTSLSAQRSAHSHTNTTTTYKCVHERTCSSRSPHRSGSGSSCPPQRALSVPDGTNNAHEEESTNQQAHEPHNSGRGFSESSCRTGMFERRGGGERCDRYHHKLVLLFTVFHACGRDRFVVNLPAVCVVLRIEGVPSTQSDAQDWFGYVRSRPRGAV